MEKDERLHEGRDESPKNIDSKDVDFVEPSKKDKAKYDTEINDSELGRNSTQTPANEQLEPMSQIDEGTKKIQQEKDNDAN